MKTFTKKKCLQHQTPCGKKKKNYWNVQQSHTGKKQANAIVIHWQHHVEVFSRILWRLSLNEKKSLAEKVQCSKEKKALGFKLFYWWYLKYYNSSQKCHPRSLVNLPCFIFYIYFIATIRDDTKTQTTIAFVWDNTMLLLYHQCCCERAKEKKETLKFIFFPFPKLWEKRQLFTTVCAPVYCHCPWMCVKCVMAIVLTRVVCIVRWGSTISATVAFCD